jgi:endonuclease YncB( thermonuclease family)
MRGVLLPVLLALTGAAGAAERLTGTVVGIADGDTLTVSDGTRQVRVRLAEIDAPERRQAFGSVARQHLAALCYRTQASVHVLSTDRYGRTVGRVRCGTTDANAAMVSAGLAWVFRRYARDPVLYRLEAEARRDRRGLWRDPAPVPPWAFRR